MKYNIFTTANKSYFPFLDMFINSLFKNANVDNIDTIYIVDMGMGDLKDHLLKSDKIKFIDAGILDTFSGVHSEGWYEATKQKTVYLHKILHEVSNPVIMIDSDTLVLEDFSSIIDSNYDMQFTFMSEGSHKGASGVVISEIACFVVCNNIEKSRKFVQMWIDQMQMFRLNQVPKPHETPAMNLLLRHFEKDDESRKNESRTVNNHGLTELKFNLLNDRLVCSDLSIYPETKVIHFKSTGTNKLTPQYNFVSRLQNVKCFSPKYSNLDYNDYLNREAFEIWWNTYSEI